MREPSQSYSPSSPIPSPQPRHPPRNIISPSTPSPFPPKQAGVREFVRVPTLGWDPEFIDVLASIVQEALPDLNQPSMQIINQGEPVRLGTGAGRGKGRGGGGERGQQATEIAVARADVRSKGRASHTFPSTQSYAMFQSPPRHLPTRRLRSMWSMST